MDKTDAPKDTPPGYAKFAEMAQLFEKVTVSHLREPDGSSVTAVRGELDGVASILTYQSKTDETSLTTTE